jgi:VWFA-related protein
MLGGRGWVGQAALWALAAATGARAAEPGEVRIRNGPYFPPNPTISVEANLVEVGVTVTDSRGLVVKHLTADDFEVLDRGKPRPVTFFSIETALSAPPEPRARTAAAGPAAPANREAGAQRTIAILFDDVHSQMYGLRQSRTAAERLLATGLPAGERMGLFTDSGAMMVDFTSDTKALLTGLARLRPHPEHTGGSAACPVLTPYQAYVIARHLDMMARQMAVGEAVACNCPDPDPTCVKIQEGLVDDLSQAVWDQSQGQSRHALDVIRVVIRHLGGEPGGRVLILVSSGFVTGGMERQRSGIVDEALRARVTIDALDAEGLLGHGESPEAQALVPGTFGGQDNRRTRWSDRTEGLRQQILSELMADATAATGGRFLHDTNDFSGSLKTLSTPPEVSYLLGFSPAGSPDGEYHAIKVRVKNREGWRVASRGGYFSAPVTRESQTAQQAIDRAALAQDHVDGVPIAVHAGLTQGEGRFTLNISTAVDARHLKFSQKRGHNLQELTFVTILEDADGHYLAGKQAVMDLNLAPATLASFRSKGFRAVTSFAVPRGTYQVREVVREAVENRLAAVNIPVNAK